MLFPDFINKFSPLVPGAGGDRGDGGAGSDKVTCTLILEHLDVDKLNYRSGIPL